MPTNDREMPKHETVARSVLKDCVGLSWDNTTAAITITPTSFLLCVQAILSRHCADLAPAAQSAPVDFERVRGIVRPFALAYRASEKVIVEDMPASDRPSHVVRSTTYWLSLKNFKDASEYLNEIASIHTPSKE